jgi:hypothetical protein
VVLGVQVLEVLVLVRPLPEVLDVAGGLRAEALELADDRRHDLKHQEDEDPEQGRVDDQDRQPAGDDPSAADSQGFEPVHSGIHRERQEDGGENPPDLGARVEHHDREQQRDRDHDQRDRDHLDDCLGLYSRGVHGELPKRKVPRVR